MPIVGELIACRMPEPIAISVEHSGRPVEIEGFGK